MNDHRSLDHNGSVVSSPLHKHFPLYINLINLYRTLLLNDHSLETKVHYMRTRMKVVKHTSCVKVKKI